MALRPFNRLSDEILDCVVLECGASSLNVCIPRVAHRWTAAATRALAMLVKLNARFIPMRGWPLEISNNGYDFNNRYIEEFKTRAEKLVAPGGAALLEKEDKERDRVVRWQQDEFLPGAFKLMRGYHPPAPLRLVRVGDKLLKTSSRDIEAGFENRFYDSDKGDSLETLVANIGRVLSKAVRVEQLVIDAGLCDYDHSGEGPGAVYHPLPLSRLPAASLERLKELTVNGKLYPAIACSIARLCPNLEKLTYDAYLDGMSGPGEHFGLVIGEPGWLHALTELKSRCTNLTTLPLLEAHPFGSLPEGYHTASITQVDALFALLRDWPTLEKVLVISCPWHPYLLHRAATFEGNRGSFEGKLSIECNYFDEHSSAFEDGQRIFDQPHICVRTTGILGL